APAATAARSSSAGGNALVDRAGPALGLAWGLGAALVLWRSARRILPFQRLVRRSPRAPRELVQDVRTVARQLGVRAPEVRVVAGVASPSIWCLGRPRLLWPAQAQAANAPRARRALIAHELAHLARRDHWVSWLEIPAAALAWWNPLFWLIRGRIRHYAELSCDAWAVWTYPADRRLFAEALIDLQARTRTAPIALQGLGATDSECKDFERRLDMIMKKRMFPGVSKGVVACAAALAVLSSPGFSGGEECSGKPGAGAALVEARVKGQELAKKAGALLDAQRSEEARALLEQVVTLDPRNGWAHGRLGYLRIQAGQLEEARQSFERQFELGYDRPSALYNAACAVARAGDAEGALERVRAAVNVGFTDVALMEKDKDLDSIRGDERFGKEVARARAAAELRQELTRLEHEKNDALFVATHAELCAIWVGDGNLQSEHGHLALKVGDPEGAALAFGRQAAAGFDVPRALYNRACARSLAGDLDGALADLSRAADEGMGYDGISKDTDLDRLRARPGFADVQARILARAEGMKGMKALLASEDAADAPALARLADDASQPEKFRFLAAQSLGKLQLRAGRFAEAHASFERAAALGLEPRFSAFGMAQALAGAGKKPEALRHVAMALDLGYDDPDAVDALLTGNALATPAEASVMVERASELRAKGKGKDAYASTGKAWAAGIKPAKLAGPKVAKE
ncbi:MAG TPA: M56 family metallopeptidase, partial [Planctomycetota bacterium]